MGEDEIEDNFSKSASSSKRLPEQTEIHEENDEDEYQPEENSEAIRTVVLDTG